MKRNEDIEKISDTLRLNSISIDRKDITYNEDHHPSYLLNETKVLDLKMIQGLKRSKRLKIKRRSNINIFNTLGLIRQVLQHPYHKDSNTNILLKQTTKYELSKQMYEIAKYAYQIKQMKDELTSTFNLQIKEYQQDMQRKRNEMDKIVIKNNELKHEKEDLILHITDMKKQFIQVVQELSQERDKVEALQGTNEKLIKLQEDASYSYEIRLTEAMSELQNALTRIMDMESLITIQTKQLTAMREHISTLNAQLRDSDIRVTERNNQLKKSVEENQRNVIARAEFEQKLQKLHDNVLIERSNVHILKEQNESIQKQLSKEQNNRLEQEELRITSEHEMLNMNSVMKQSNREIKQLRKEIEIYVKESEDYKSNMLQMTQTINTQKLELNEMEMKLHLAILQLKVEKEEGASKEYSIQKAFQKIHDLEQRLREVESEKMETQTQVDAFSHSVDVNQFGYTPTSDSMTLPLMNTNDRKSSISLDFLSLEEDEHMGLLTE